MYPILLKIGIIQISSLSVFLLLSFLIGIYIIWKQAKERLYTEEIVFDTTFIVLVSGFLSARIAYIALHFSEFGFNVLKWIAFPHFPGLYFYGGFFGGIATLFFLRRKVRDGTSGSFWEFLDIIAFSFWFAYIIAAFGVFLDGSEVGHASAISGVLHPVTLYKILALLALLTPYLWYRLERGQKVRTQWLHKKSGVFALLFFALFGLLLFLVDFFKAFSVYYGHLAFDQWVSIALLLGSIIGLFFRARCGKKEIIRFFRRLIKHDYLSKKTTKTNRAVPQT